MDNRAYPPLYRPRPKRHDWRNWIIALAALILLASACWLATAAQASTLPPRPGTERTLPAPVGRHERALWCRYAPHVRPGNAACRSYR